MLEKLLADTAVDILLEEVNSDREPVTTVKRGFFVREPYIKSSSRLAGTRKLITEAYVKKLVREGFRRLELPEKAIITPSARLLIEEKGITVVR